MAMSSLVLHEPAGSHPNATGNYLAACVFFAHSCPRALRSLRYEGQVPTRAAWRTAAPERSSVTRYNSEDWVSPKIEIRVSAIDGKGTFAREPIRVGEVVTVWGGPLFTTEEIRAGKARRDRLVGVVKVSAGLYMGTPQGGEAGATDYLNHSCKPNLWMNDEVTLAARRDVGAGEELTADYAMWSDDPSWVAPVDLPLRIIFMPKDDHGERLAVAGIAGTLQGPLLTDDR